MSIRGYMQQVQLVLSRRIVLFAICIYMSLYLLEWGHDALSDVKDDDGIFSMARASVSGILLLAYGFYRSGRFHPFVMPAYRRYLSTGPWQCGKPLPLGPVRLMTFEWLLIPLGTLLAAYELGFFGKPIALQLIGLPSFDSAASWIATEPMLLGEIFCIMGICLLGPNVLLLGIHIYKDKLTWRLFIFTWPLMVLIPYGGAAKVFFLLLVLYLIVHWGIQRMLSKFPWAYPEYDADPIARLREEAGAGSMVGPMFQTLGPVYRHRSISTSDAAARSFLIVWWVVLLVWLFFNDSFQELTERMSLADLHAGLLHEWVRIWTVLLLSLTVIRFLIYRKGTKPPLTLMARFRTGRLIIPRHDIIYVTPLLIFGFGMILPGLVGLLPISALLQTAICLFIILFASMACGPTREKWRMTGLYHIPQDAIQMNSDLWSDE